MLIGKLISQGASRSEVVGAARIEGWMDGQIEEVKVRIRCRKILKLILQDIRLSSCNSIL